MNLREERFITGASDLLRVVYVKGGRRVSVIDRVRRRRQAIHVLLDAGHRVIDIARILRCDRDLVLSEKENRKCSDNFLALWR